MLNRVVFGARLSSRARGITARMISDARDSRVMLTHKRGMDIIQDPDLNKVRRAIILLFQELPIAFLLRKKFF